jgi:uncharacterized membrane protein
MEQFDKTNITTRLQSLDIIRGAIIVLMAIDHVRVYSGIPANSFDTGIFFTRWITHFCAPGFAFLAGTSAFLYGQKKLDIGKLTSFLLSRGLLLVLLEVTLIRFFWTFNFDYANFFLAGVIWMLGWCMVLMAFLVRFKPLTVGIMGLLIIFFQQGFKYLPKILPNSLQPSFGKFWEFIYPSEMQGVDGVTILYVIVPWIGVMAAGYGFGLIMNFEEGKRRKICLTIGFSAILIFLVAGSIIIYSQPKSDQNSSFLLSLLNQKKYPASQLFLLMTLGPIITLIPLAEKAKNGFANILSVFGRVPLFYYLLHIPLIHLSALLFNFITKDSSFGDLYATAPFTFLPDEQRWSLLSLYLVFAIDIVILYFSCKWYAKVKSQSINRFFEFI